ncbi:MAG: DUF3368 domain-containing protein [Planctomycetaceae bacterium]|jgi:predicted nucleic acid-binding protein|nr:DUF3368 domain-containing protein [Planctomycetaceae bacterium]
MSFPELVISDTSCLVNLERIDSLLLLKKLFEKIVITEEVAMEFGRKLPDWIEVRKTPQLFLQSLQNKKLHLGELSVLALGLELKRNCLLLIDDEVARNECQRLGFRFIGLLGVLLRAKDAGIIEQIRPLIERLQEAGFRMSQNLIQEVLCQAGEL